MDRQKCLCFLSTAGAAHVLAVCLLPIELAAGCAAVRDCTSSSPMEAPMSTAWSSGARAPGARVVGQFLVVLCLSRDCADLKEYRKRATNCVHLLPRFRNFACTRGARFMPNIYRRAFSMTAGPVRVGSIQTSYHVAILNELYRARRPGFYWFFTTVVLPLTAKCLYFQAPRCIILCERWIELPERPGTLLER